MPAKAMFSPKRAAVGSEVDRDAARALQVIRIRLPAPAPLDRQSHQVFVGVHRELCGGVL
jgi:hypothetical protein